MAGLRRSETGRAMTRGSCEQREGSRAVSLPAAALDLITAAREITALEGGLPGQSRPILEHGLAAPPRRPRGSGPKPAPQHWRRRPRRLPLAGTRADPDTSGTPLRRGQSCRDSSSRVLLSSGRAARSLSRPVAALDRITSAREITDTRSSGSVDTLSSSASRARSV